MAVAALSDIAQELQTTVKTILENDTTSLAVTHADGTTDTFTLGDLKIVDGMPEDLIKGTSKSYVIVHTPEESTERHTQTLYKSMLDLEIEVFNGKEGNMRIIVDAIRKRLRAQEATTQAKKFRMPMGARIRTSKSVVFLDGEKNSRVWRMSMVFPYFWIGS